MLRPLKLVVNQNAGAFTKGLELDAVVSGLEAAGWPSVEVVDITDQPGGDPACNLDGEDCVLAVAAGDGTINALASSLIALRAPPPLLILPAGTANLLSKRVSGDVDMESVLTLSVDYQPRTIPVGYIGDNIFTIAAALGITPAFAKAREGLRDPDRKGRLIATLRYLLVGFRNITQSYLGFRLDRADRLRRARAAYVSVGHMADAHAQTDDVSFDSMLEIYGARLSSVVDFSLLLAHTALGDIRDYKRSWRSTARQITVYSKRRIPIIVDGEPGYVSGPLDLKIVNDALCILAPKP